MQGVTHNGYGQAVWKQEAWRAHRLSFTVYCGDIPENFAVCHKCDNPPCINPEHLFVGTMLDNHQDRNRKGRQASGDRNGSRTKPECLARGSRSGAYTKPESILRGSKHARSVFVESQIIEIRQLHASGWSYAKLAEKARCSKSAIAHVIKGRVWGHVTAENKIEDEAKNMFGQDRNDADNPFATIDQVDAAGSRNPYLLDGQYHLRIKTVKTFTSRDGILFFMSELEIISSNNADRQPGQLVTWMTKLKSDMGPITTKRFLAAANGIDPDSPQANVEITSEVAQFACSADQPLTGNELLVQCNTIETKKKTPFLDCKWIPIVSDPAA